MARESEKGRIKQSTAPLIQAHLILGNGKQININQMYEKFEYTSMVNEGEVSKLLINDPHFTLFNSLRVDYLKYGMTDAPIIVRIKMRWPENTETEYINHACIVLRPYTPSRDRGQIEIVGIDIPSFYLNGGDAGGYAYRGTIKEVIEQVVEKYGRGKLRVDVRTPTKDNKYKIWHQNRMHPKAFIASMLEWSATISDLGTQWRCYPLTTGELSNSYKLVIQEQASVESKNRATYKYGLYGAGESVGPDVALWEMPCDHALKLSGHNLVTHGISAVSGAYYDRRTDGRKEIVYVGDRQTSSKYITKTDAELSFTNLDPNKNPLDDKLCGWTSCPSNPEFNDGDIGLKYSEYIDGVAKNRYYQTVANYHRCNLKLRGHKIWVGSEGLGVDTVNLVAFTANSQEQFISGNWMVNGYNHLLERAGTWSTTLYCSRHEHNLTGTKVGK